MTYWGRVVKVIQPLDSSTEPTQEFEYDLTVVPNRTVTKVKSSKAGEAFSQLITYSFTDGLGRELQRRSPAEDPAKQIVTGVVEFNERGEVEKEYVPFFDTLSTTYLVPPTSTLAHATFYTDALGRRTRIEYPDASVSRVSFEGLLKRTIDPRGIEKRYTSDAYGRPGGGRGAQQWRELLYGL